MGMVKRKLKFVEMKISWCHVKNMDDIPVQMIFISESGYGCNVDISKNDFQIMIDALNEAKEAIDKINE